MDSLKKLIVIGNNYKSKIQAYTKLCDILATKNFDECLLVSHEAQHYSIANNDSVSYADFLRVEGDAEYFSGRFDIAASKFYQSISILERKNSLLLLAQAYNSLAKLYRKTKQLDRAINIYNRSFTIYKELNNKDGMATILNESGVVFEYKNDFEKAIKQYLASLQIREQLKDSVGVAYSYNFLGGAYTQLHNYKNAENYLLKSQAIRTALKDSFSMALNYSDLASMYQEKGDMNKAIESVEKSNDIAKRFKYLDLQSVNYKQLSEINNVKGDYKSALELFKNHIAIKDSIYYLEKINKIEELNLKYQSAEKEKTIQQKDFEITKRNYLVVGLLLLTIFGSLLGYNYYHRYKLKKDKQLQAEIFNQQELATKAIVEAEENERKRIASDLHDGVGQLMSAAKMNLSSIENEIPFANDSQRKVYDKVQNLVDESCKEVRNVSHNIMPNALLKAGLASAVREFINQIDWRVIKVDLYTEGLNERIDANVETVLYRIVQECVNNVIKHAAATHLDISLIKDANGIAATIEDNGKGFNTTDDNKFDGIGLKNIKTRIAYLKGTIEWNSSIGNGTLVAMHIPMNNNYI